MKTLEHKFVENIPENIEEGILYVSIPFETVIHKCCCGCGNEVVTPLSPTDWNLTFDGETITLNPSIGSWSLECKSHYFIRNNKVVWSTPFNEEKIKKVRKHDIKDKISYYQEDDSLKDNLPKEKVKNKVKRKSFWKRLFSKW